MPVWLIANCISLIRIEVFTALLVSLSYDEHKCAYRHDWSEMFGKYLYVDAHMYQNLKINPLFTASAIALTFQVKLMYIKC